MWQQENNIDYLKGNILAFLESLKIDEFNYRMSRNTDSTIYSSIFALFLYDLIGAVGNWEKPVKENWINFINSFQDVRSGLFIPNHLTLRGIENKPVYQLTAFSLQALHILEGVPKYELSFLNNWQTKESIRNYLDKQGCLHGKLGSGNMSMFLGIFLTYSYEELKNNKAKVLLDEWFFLHDKYQNPKTGFWGSKIKNFYYWGFQNSLHQFEIYNYWNREINYSEIIIDKILSLQNTDGHFALTPGGGGCWDYDAAHLLSVLSQDNEYRRMDILKSFEILYTKLINKINPDFGIPESISRPESFGELIKLGKFIFSPRSPYIWYLKLVATLKSYKDKNIIRTHWCNKSYSCSQSDLWNTWLYMILILELEMNLNKGSKNHKNRNIKKQDFIGLGYLRKYE